MSEDHGKFAGNDAVPVWPDYLTPSQASHYLKSKGVKRAVSTLGKLRCLGGGPLFRRAGSREVFYEKGDLDAYVANIVGPKMAATSVQAAA